MQKFLVLALTAVMLLGVCGTAQAAKMWDDMSWWGNTGATPEPYADPKGRSGYWWWPTEPASNAGDAELWGNRGIVYHMPWEKPKMEEPPAPPPVVAPPKAKREIPVFSHVLFDFDKAVLKPEGKEAVNQVVDYLKQYGQDKVAIEGHTCDIGTDDYNMGLGQRRADAVQKYMLENGIDAGRVSTVSYGESQPAVANDSPANRKLNRRAVFKITLGD